MSEVHPETGETPEEVKERLDSALEEHINNEARKDNEALQALVEQTEESSKHTVELTGGIEVEVKTSLPAHLENKAATMDEKDVDEGLGTVVEIIATLIVDDEYANKEVWVGFYEQLGSSMLMDNFERVTEPYFEANKSRQEKMQERRDAVDGFRNQ